MRTGILILLALVGCGPEPELYRNDYVGDYYPDFEQVCEDWTPPDRFIKEFHGFTCAAYYDGRTGPSEWTRRILMQESAKGYCREDVKFHGLPNQRPYSNTAFRVWRSLDCSLADAADAEWRYDARLPVPELFLAQLPD